MIYDLIRRLIDEGRIEDAAIIVDALRAVHEGALSQAQAVRGALQSIPEVESIDRLTEELARYRAARSQVGKANASKPRGGIYPKWMRDIAIASDTPSAALKRIKQSAPRHGWTSDIPTVQAIKKWRT